MISQKAKYALRALAALARAEPRRPMLIAEIAEQLGDGHQMARIDEALVAGSYDSRLVLQVHDEVIVEVPADEHDVGGDLVIDLMRHAAQLDVPLEVNVSWGDTWAAAKG